MKTTTRVKKINGHEYLYEITYYYDKETRRTRQKSKYLGKNVDGKPVRVREKAKSPEKVFTYGEFVPYLIAINTLSLQETLGAHLTEHETRICLTLAMAALICPDAIHNPVSWYEGTVLARMYPGLKITPQTISRVLRKLGDSVIPMEICRSLLQENEPGESRAHDLKIPHVLSSSMDHNKDPVFRFFDQITLYYDQDIGIPTAYIPHSRSLTAAHLVKSAVSGMHIFRYRQTTLIPGRTFTSSRNLYGLIFSGTPFIIPISPENPLVRDELKKHRAELMHPKNLKIFHGETLFIIPITVPVESVQMHGFICYSPRKDEEDRREYTDDLSLIIESLNDTPVYRWEDPAETIRDIAGAYEQFLQWKTVGNRLQVSIRSKVVSRHRRDSGVSIFLYTGGEYHWDQCLQWASEQAEDEAFFRIHAEKFQVYPHTVDTETIRQGIYLIVFLSLMMKRWVERQFEASGLLSVSSAQKIMIELAKIRLIGLGNERTIITGNNSRQQDILESLKWQLDFSA